MKQSPIIVRKAHRRRLPKGFNVFSVEAIKEMLKILKQQRQVPRKNYMVVNPEAVKHWLGVDLGDYVESKKA